MINRERYFNVQKLPLFMETEKNSSSKAYRGLEAQSLYQIQRDYNMLRDKESNCSLGESEKVFITI